MYTSTLLITAEFLPIDSDVSVQLLLRQSQLLLRTRGMS